MMNAQNNNHELPVPNRGGVDIYDPKNPEINSNIQDNQPVSSPEKEPKANKIPTASQAVAAVQQSSSVQATSIQTPLTTDDDKSITAQDVDVIEKAWVVRAKDVVAKTSSNPSEQTVELAKVKSDYLKQRYGKEIKLPQEK